MHGMVFQPINMKNEQNITGSNTLTEDTTAPADSTPNTPGGTKPAQRERVHAALERVGMADFARRSIGQLSNGQFQRVLFARMLVQDAKFLLLDEPFNAVDARTTYELLEVLRQCHQNEGRAVIAVLHDYEQVRAYFPYTFLIAREKIVSGATADVLTEGYLKQAAEAMHRTEPREWCAA